MKNLFMILICLVVLSGCCTQKRCNQKYPPAQSASDSSMVTTSESVQEKDSISYLPADSSWLKALLECNEYGQVVMKELQGYKSGKNAGVPQVSVKDNVLTAKCKTDSLAVFNHYSKHFKKEVEYRDRKVTETKYINELTKGQKRMITAFWIESLILLITGLFLTSKIIRK